MNTQHQGSRGRVGPPDHLIFIPAVCERLHVSSTTAYRMIASGEARVVKVGRKWLSTPAEIDRLFEAAASRTLTRKAA